MLTSNQQNEQTVYNAFTLAEVLITLGIIGVVAAMTIPTLINNYQKQQAVTQYKKAYAEMTQVIKMSEVDNGEMRIWDMSAFAAGAAKTQEFADQYFYPYVKTIKKCTFGETGCWTPPASLSNQSGYLTLNAYSLSAVMPSGYSVLFWKSNVEAGGHVVIYVDIDGPSKGRAMIGKDVFGIKVNLNDGDATQQMGIHPMGLGNIPEVSRATLLTTCSKTFVDSTAGSTCAGVIATDGWTISSDYPW